MKKFNLFRSEEDKKENQNIKISPTNNSEKIGNENEHHICEYGTDANCHEMQEINELRKTNVKHFKVDKNTNRMYISSKPLHYYSNNENKFKEIDIKFEEEKGYYSHFDGIHKLRFAKSSNDAKIFELEKDDCKVELLYSDEIKEESKTKKYHRHKKGVSAICRKKDKTKTEISFDNYFEDSSLQYLIEANGIKENIIIHKKLDNYNYSFILKLTNLKLTLSKDNKSIELINVNTNQHTFNIPAPIMYDNAQQQSQEVFFEVEEIEKGIYNFRIIASQEWINHKSRLFPVTIDPQIVYQTSKFVEITGIQLGKNGNHESHLGIKVANIDVVKIKQIKLYAKFTINLLKRILKYQIKNNGITFYESTIQPTGDMYAYLDFDFSTQINNFINGELQLTMEYVNDGIDQSNYIIKTDDYYLLIDYHNQINENIMEHSDSLFSLNLKRAGNTHYNLYNSKMIYEHKDIISDFNLTHIYNTEFIEKDFPFSTYMGKGFKLNIHQYLKKDINKKAANLQGKIATYFDSYGDKYDFIGKYYYIEKGLKKFVDFEKCYEKEEKTGSYFSLINGEEKEVFYASFCNDLILVADHSYGLDTDWLDKIDQVSAIIHYYIKDGERNYVKVTAGKFVIKDSFFFIYNGREYEISQPIESLFKRPNTIINVECHKYPNVPKEIISSNGKIVFQIPKSYTIDPNGKIMIVAYEDIELFTEYDNISNHLPLSFVTERILNLEKTIGEINEYLFNLEEEIINYENAKIDGDNNKLLLLKEEGYRQENQKYTDLVNTYNEQLNDLLAELYTNIPKNSTYVESDYPKSNDGEQNTSITNTSLRTSGGGKDPDDNDYDYEVLESLTREFESDKRLLDYEFNQAIDKSKLHLSDLSEDITNLRLLNGVASIDKRNLEYDKTIKKLNNKISYYISQKSLVCKILNDILDEYKKEPMDYIISGDNILGFDYYGKLVSINNTKIVYQDDKVIRIDLPDSKNILFEYEEDKLSKIIDPLYRETKYFYEDNLYLWTMIYQNNDQTKIRYIDGKINLIIDQSGYLLQITKQNNEQINFNIGSDTCRIDNYNVTYLSDYIKTYCIWKKSEYTTQYKISTDYSVTSYIFDNNGRVVSRYNHNESNDTNKLSVNYVISNDYSDKKTSFKTQIDFSKKVFSSSFENQANYINTGGYTIESDNYASGGKSLSLFGTGATKNVTIPVTIDSIPLNKCLIFSLWAKANSAIIVPNRIINAEEQGYDSHDTNLRLRKFGYSVEIKYINDETIDISETSFDCYNRDWQLATLPIRFRHNDTSLVEYINVILRYDYNFDKCYFDNLCIYEGTFELYNYHEDGKINSIDNGENITYVDEYNSLSQITKMRTVDITGKKFSSSNHYDTDGRLLKTISHNGIIKEYIYENGEFVKIKIYHKDEPASAFWQENKYDNEGRLLEKYDSLGEVNGMQLSTKYQYHPNSNLVSCITDSKNNKIFYGYDSDTDNLINITASCEGQKNSSICQYNKGYLTKMEHDGAEFDYVYDGFGRILEINISGKNYLTNIYTRDNSYEAKETNYSNGSSFMIRKNYDHSEAIYYYRKKNGELINVGLSEKDRLTSYVDDLTIYSNKDIYCWKRNDETIFEKKYNYFECGFSEVSSLFSSNHGLSTVYTYNNAFEKRVDKILYNDKYEQNIKYDRLGRTKEISIKASKPIIGSIINYYENGDHTTNMVTSIKYINNEKIGKIVKYEYDLFGNISDIKENGVLIKRYKYDNMNRLVREDNKDMDSTIIYEYDQNGNILYKNLYPFKLGKDYGDGIKCFYNYDEDWKDQLSSYDGEICEYDEIGNPWLYRGISFEWSNGRELVCINPSESEKVEFKYLLNGNRYKKICHSYEVDYYYEGSKLIFEKRADGILVFSYGIGGITGFSYNNCTYYYQKNLQGDITDVYNSNGEIVAKYCYNAWGETKVENLTDENIGDLNPFRYRSYYYDSEIGLYFLNSRFYDPEVGRFLNADDISYLDPKTINGLNLYAYCLNNPVIFYDPSGQFPILAILIVAGILCTPIGGAIAQYAVSSISYKAVTLLAVGDLIFNDGRGAWTDMKNIGWNPFNSNESKVADSTYVSWYKGMPVFRKKGSSFSYLVIGLTTDRPFTGDSGHQWTATDILKHEYGHGIQQLFYGPLGYGFRVAIPSVFVDNSDDAPWEITADLFGGVKRNYNQNDILRGWNWFRYGFQPIMI